MKRMIRASVTTAEKVAKFVEFLYNEGIDDREILNYFLSELDSEECLDILKKFADMSDIDYLDLAD